MYLIALVAGWYCPVCKAYPFYFSDSSELRTADYTIVASALYSESIFKEHEQEFWSALKRSSCRQARFLTWYYGFVLSLAFACGFGIKNYGRFRRSSGFRWIADLYLLPHISQWYVLLTPFTFEDKRTAVKADILMTDNTLYRGTVAEHFIDKDGNLSGVFLGHPQRFDRRSYLREQDAWHTVRTAAQFWRPIPSAKLYLVADKIVNMNLNYQPPLEAPDSDDIVRRFVYGKGISRNVQFTITIDVPKS